MSNEMESFPIPAPAFNGNSRVIAAGNGFEWLKQGWAIFSVNPGLWVAITLLLIVAFIAVNIVWLVGPMAANLLTPLIGAGLMAICQKASDAEAFIIEDIFAGFGTNTNALVILGVIYMGSLLVVDAITGLLIGGSVVGGLVMGSPAGFGVLLGGSMVALLLKLACLVPLSMAMWFAPALVFFNNMSPFDALKASFNACLKNTLPFLVYGLMVMVLLFFAALPVGLGFLVLIPVLAGSIYVSYRDIFVAN
jgi:uncharacterized membrane protein